MNIIFIYLIYFDFGTSILQWGGGGGVELRISGVSLIQPSRLIDNHFLSYTDSHYTDAY